MQRKFWLVAAVVAGVVIGSAVNMTLIMVSGHIIAPPAGADVTTTEGLKATMRLFEPKHFIFPFLAHSLGTLVGAMVAAAMTPQRTVGPAFFVGGLFLLGGIASVFMLPAALWYSVVDLVGAYVPMAWLGHRLVQRTLRVSPLNSE